jgi:hypothetical protein
MYRSTAVAEATLHPPQTERAAFCRGGPFDQKSGWRVASTLPSNVTGISSPSATKAELRGNMKRGTSDPTQHAALAHTRPKRRTERSMETISCDDQGRCRCNHSRYSEEGNSPTRPWLRNRQLFSRSALTNGPVHSLFCGASTLERVFRSEMGPTDVFHLDEIRPNMTPKPAFNAGTVADILEEHTHPACPETPDGPLRIPWSLPNMTSY